MDRNTHVKSNRFAFAYICGVGGGCDRLRLPISESSLMKTHIDARDLCRANNEFASTLAEARSSSGPHLVA